MYYPVLLFQLVENKLYFVIHVLPGIAVSIVMYYTTETSVLPALHNKKNLAKLEDIIVCIKI